MRIAICISGFLRTWDYNKKTFTDVFCKGLDMSNVDIFIHTYNQNYHEFSAGIKDVTYTNEEILEKFEGLPIRDYIIENRTEEWLRENLVRPSLEKYRNVPNFTGEIVESSDPNTLKIPLGTRIYDQLRVMESANNLRKGYEKTAGISYDLVAKTRFDIYYHSTPTWSVKTLGNGKIHPDIGTTDGYPPDCVCVSTPEVMDNTYACRFSNLDKIYSPLNKRRTSCAHYTLYFMMRSTKTTIGVICCVASVARAPNKFHVPGIVGNCDLKKTLTVRRYYRT